MNILLDTSPDPSLLPSAFGPDELWAVSLVDTRFGSQIEPLLLCDPDTGLDRIQQDYANGTATHALAMAFSLSHLRRLRAAIESDAADAELIDAQSLGVSRAWPLWLPTHSHIFVALVEQAGHAASMWVRATTRAEVHAALAVLHPGAQVMGVGSVGEFQAQTDRLERIHRDQDFGALARDLRTQVERPATQAHITGYPMAALGLFPSVDHAMATHQAMFLDDEAELVSGH